MDLKFRVAARISRPVHEVFEAVADPQKLSNYFTTGGAKGRLETGATVTWDFHDYPGAFPVEVVEVVPDEKIVLKWEANEGEPPNLSDSDGKVREAKYQTTVTMTFSPLVLAEGNDRIFNLAALCVFVSILAHGLTDTPGSNWVETICLRSVRHRCIRSQTLRLRSA